MKTIGYMQKLVKPVFDEGLEINTSRREKVFAFSGKQVVIGGEIVDHDSAPHDRTMRDVHDGFVLAGAVMSTALVALKLLKDLK